MGFVGTILEAKMEGTLTYILIYHTYILIRFIISAVYWKNSLVNKDEASVA